MTPHIYAMVVATMLCMHDWMRCMRNAAASARLHPELDRAMQNDSTMQPRGAPVPPECCCKDIVNLHITGRPGLARLRYSFN